MHFGMKVCAFFRKNNVMSVGEFNTQQKVLKGGRRVLPHINYFTMPHWLTSKVILLTK